MSERAKVIQLGVSQGLTNLNDIHKIYNTFADGGYLDWINKVKEWRPGIAEDIDADEPTYDYEGFFNDNPEYAWSMLNGDPEAHFTDKFKKPNHPTFSDESIYSTPETPGGHWHENYGGGGRWVYEPSEYTKKNKKTTIEYLRNSGEGYLEGMNVTFYNRYKDGGNIDWDDSPEGIATNAAIGLIPIVGTVNEARQLIENPSWEQAGWTALSLLGDAATIFTFGAGEGAKAAITTAKATRSLSKASRAYKQSKAASKAARASRRAEKAYQADVVTRRGGPSVSRRTTLRREAANNRLLDGPTYFQRESKRLNNQEKLNRGISVFEQGIQAGLEGLNYKK